MCLGIPAKIIRVSGADSLLPMAQMDFVGVCKEICLAYVPQAQVGDYVIVHAGFAISQIAERQAQETLNLLAQIGVMVSQPE